MDDRLSLLETRVAELGRTVAALEGRLLAVEGGQGAEAAVPATIGAVVDAAPGPVHRDERIDLVAILSLTGRLFIVLGGGFLLRAMTEAGTLPPLAGVVTGLVYALASVVAADRAAARARPWSAMFHVGAAALVGFPLIWEATIRFKTLTPAASAVVLCAFLAVPMAVAWRRRLQGLAWVATIGALVTSLALIAGTREVVPVALLLIGLGTVTLWMGYSLDWVGLRWPVAAVVNLVVSALTLRALAPQPQDSAVVTVAVQVLLVAAYLGSIGIRTLVRQRNVVPFEVVQTAGVLLVGFGGAVAVARATGGGVGLLGGVCLAFGAASYAVAFGFLDRQRHLQRNVYFHTSVGIVFILAGCALLWNASILVVAWSALAALGCALWARVSRFFLLIHGAIYLVAAGVAIGAFSYGAGVIVTAPPAPWVTPSWHLLAVLVAAGACVWWASEHSGGSTVGAFLHVPRLLIVVTFVWAVGGEVIGMLAPVVAGRGPGAVDPGTLATLRTSVLSLAALAIAYVGRHERFVEWSWLVYPLLVVIGFKMIAQDFSASRPATLFVALALYGLALIVAPRLRRSRGALAPAAS